MTLVFLHGSGCSKEVWTHQVSFFKNSLALNLPGHPDGQALDNVPALAQWLSEQLASMDLSDVVLVGHSLGSAIAIQAALLRGARIKALVLIGSGARLKVMPQLLESLKKLDEEGSEIPDYLLAANQTISEPLRTKVNTSIKEHGARVMLKDFLACNHFDVMDDLYKIRLPVQLIVGDMDQMTPVKYSLYLKEKLKNARLDIVEGGTHMVFAEQPDKVNRTIECFIEMLC